MGLRQFHLLFILLVIVGADLFGGWAVRDYLVHGEPEILWLGIVSIVGGLGLCVYVWRVAIRLARLAS